MLARLWHGALAIVVLVGMLIQVVLVARLPAAPHDTAAGVIAGATAPARYLRTLSFFTIQANLLVGITSAQLARNPSREGAVWRVARLNGLVGIAVTGIVYTTVLARIHEPKGWEQVSTNTLFHYVTPIAAVVGWLLFGPRPRIDPRTFRWALAWPIAYFAYTMLRGTTDKWYPYPFVDVATHGYLRVLLNAVLVTLVLAAVSGLFWLGDRQLWLGPGPAMRDRRPTRPRSRRA